MVLQLAMSNAPQAATSTRVPSSSRHPPAAPAPSAAPVAAEDGESSDESLDLDGDYEEEVILG